MASRAASTAARVVSSIASELRAKAALGVAGCWDAASRGAITVSAASINNVIE
jgi:hypothetical protein